ncbi:hypothetical protein KSF73_07910 [Burkholderiaceae bacterium DAT-1]|nr:hypothetical protein [Burkholderiaceae bacterium DAT-1]
MSDSVLSSPIPPEEPRFTRALRLLVRIVLTIIGMLALLWATFKWVNRHDQPLTPDSQAWLTPPAAPASNGFNAFYALTLKTNELQATGDRIAAKLMALPPLERDARFDAILKAEGQTIPLSEVDQVCKSKTANCLDDIRAHNDTLNASMAANAELLDRYRRVVATRDSVYTGNMGLMSFSLVNGLVSLNMADALFKLKAKDLSGLDHVLNSQRFWMRASLAPDSVMAEVIMQANLKRHIKFINALLDEQPALGPHVRTMLMPTLTEWQAQPDTVTWTHMLQGEFRFVASMLDSVRKAPPQTDDDCDSGSACARFDHWLSKQALQRNDTLNIMQTYYARAAATGAFPKESSCDSAFSLYNPAGHIMACQSFVDGGDSVYFKTLRPEIAALANRLAPA